MNKVCAIIAAAGKGKRMGAAQNKQYIDINGKPLLYYTLKAFSECELIDDIIVTVSLDELEYCKSEIIEKYEFNKVNKLVSGGKERQESVFNALKSVEDADIVVIHDGARPFVSSEIIENGILYAGKYGASACGVDPKDTIKVRGEGGFSESTLERSRLVSIQTPQCFKYEIIYDSHKKAAEEKLNFTDDTAVVEHYGHKVFIYDGSYKNIKITTPEDLAWARLFM